MSRLATLDQEKNIPRVRSIAVRVPVGIPEVGLGVVARPGSTGDLGLRQAFKLTRIGSGAIGKADGLGCPESRFATDLTGNRPLAPLI